MTTAARPTFDTAKGGTCVNDREIGKLSHLVSSRDLPAHLTLKERLQGQDTIDELKQRNFKQELDEREKIAQIEKSKAPQYKYVPSLEQTAQIRLALKAEKNQERESLREALLRNESELDESVRTTVSLVNARKVAQLDKDEDFGSDNDLSESDFEDDDDDEAELMAELNKIKQERQEEGEQREREKMDKEDRIGTISSKDSVASFTVKRRWDDDVPFKNCARDGSDSKKFYVNDTLRQEFHKRFMDRYIR